LPSPQSPVPLGDGAGHFKPAYDLGTAKDRSYSGRLVDLDRDGDLDVVISNDEPDPKLVYLNDGKGHFHVGSTFGKPGWPTRNATVADINGDGLPDIVVANRGDSTSANYICLNRGVDDSTPIALRSRASPRRRSPRRTSIATG
jgi:VCBS repeat protein